MEPQPSITLTPDQEDQLADLVVSKLLAAKKSDFSWAKVRGNPYFVTASSSLVGAFGSEVYQAIQVGGFTWTTKAIEGMIVSALSVTAVALYHLYQNPPSTTAALKGVQKY